MIRFFFSADPLRDTGRAMAAGALLVGLLLIGFGLLVFILKDLFAFLAAAVFFMAGFSAIIYAVRIYWLTRKIKPPSDGYRENVEIHYPDFFE